MAISIANCAMVASLPQLDTGGLAALLGLIMIRTMF